MGCLGHELQIVFTCDLIDIHVKRWHADFVRGSFIFISSIGSHHELATCDVSHAGELLERLWSGLFG
jgi:hypothetical protein